MGWAERHPIRAKKLMKFYGIRGELDVLKCPELQEKTGWTRKAYRRRLGNLRSTAS